MKSVKFESLPRYVINTFLDLYLICKEEAKSIKFEIIDYDKNNSDGSIKIKSFRTNDFNINFFLRSEFISDYIEVHFKDAIDSIKAYSENDFSRKHIHEFIKYNLGVEKIDWNKIDLLKQQFYHEHRGSLAASNLGLLENLNEHISSDDDSFIEHQWSGNKNYSRIKLSDLPVPVAELFMPIFFTLEQNSASPKWYNSSDIYILTFIDKTDKLNLIRIVHMKRFGVYDQLHVKRLDSDGDIESDIMIKTFNFINTSDKLKSFYKLFDYKKDDDFIKTKIAEFFHNIRGKISMSKLGLIESFIYESEEKSNFKEIEFFDSLIRDYESENVFFTDELQFKVLEERKDWKDILSQVERGISKDIKCHYLLRYEQNGSKKTLEIDFKMNFSGQEDRDEISTENATTDQTGIILEDIEIRKIVVVESNSEWKSSGSSMSEELKNVIFKFMMKMLEPNYDVLSANLSRIKMS